MVVSEYSFDAWGRRRSADDWSYTMDANDLALFADRGFTGHEHLSWFNLVNMNGRLYDPLVGRFLNVDNVIQDPTFTQNYNRYSYCLNNPLKFTDPSGNRMIWNRHTQSYERVADDSGGGSTDYWGGGGYGAPGQGQNGTGLNGFYYDWYSGTMRSTDAGNVAVGWGYASNIIEKYGSPASSLIFSGTRQNPYENLRGIHYADGSTWYAGEVYTSVSGGRGVMDWVQGGLDVVGLIPVVGEVADGANALIYAARGDYLNSGLSAAAMIPIAGWAATGAKAVNKTIQLTAKARTAERGLELAEKFLKPGYSEIAPGVFRSSDQLRQFRMTTSDITGAHGSGPHFNFEIFSPLNLNKAATNYHVQIINP